MILDTCSVKELLKNKQFSYFFKCYILNFQKEELSKKEFLQFESYGGKVLNSKSYVHRDFGFFDLDLNTVICTRDRKLKKALKKNGYLVLNHPSEKENI